MSAAGKLIHVILDYANRTYRKREQRAALRCGLDDAAHLCDAIADDILAENTGKGRKKPTKLGIQLAEIAKRCGDAIWELRENIEAEE